MTQATDQSQAAGELTNLHLGKLLIYSPSDKVALRAPIVSIQHEARANETAGDSLVTTLTVKIGGTSGGDDDFTLVSFEFDGEKRLDLE